MKLQGRMQEQLMTWHFNCQAERPPGDAPHVSLELSVSKAKELRGSKYFRGQEYKAWTCSMQGKLEFPLKPWQCEWQQTFFTFEAKTGEGTIVLQLRDRDCVIMAFDVLLGRRIASAVLARHRSEQSSAEWMTGL